MTGPRIITSVKIRQSIVCPSCKKPIEVKISLDDSHDGDMQIGGILQVALDSDKVVLHSRGRNRIKMDNICNVLARLNDSAFEIKKSIEQSVNKAGDSIEVHQAIIKKK